MINFNTAILSASLCIAIIYNLPLAAETANRITAYQQATATPVEVLKTPVPTRAAHNGLIKNSNLAERWSKEEVEKIKELNAPYDPNFEPTFDMPSPEEENEITA